MANSFLDDGGNMNDDKTRIKLPDDFQKKFNLDHAGMLYQKLKVSLYDVSGSLSKQFLFTNQFTVGRSPDNDIVIPSKLVSRFHFKVEWENDSWWVCNLNSTNGIYINHQLIQEKILLNPPVIISLGAANISLEIEVIQESIDIPLNNENIHSKTASEPLVQIERLNQNLSKDKLKARLLAKTEAEDVGDYTRMVRKIIHEDRTDYSKGYRKIIVWLGCLFLVFAGLVTYQQMALMNARTLAIGMFYDIKALEVSLSQAEIRLDESAEVLDLTLKVIVDQKLGIDRERIKSERDKLANERKRVLQERQKLANMKLKYQQYVDEAKSLRIRFPSDAQYEEELIAKVARELGESELELPEGFVAEVRKYTKYWQDSTRMQQAIDRLEKNLYAPVIIEALEKEGLPLYFMYLPLQESNYDTHAIGPETRFGIAKGAWQFLATTAQEYGLLPGPLINARVFDEKDERFDFVRSTKAGAKYLKHIYSTEAQASGLLVIASYNYGHSRVKSLISKMQDNPRDRNFWKFIQQHNLPKETYDYVFYIFSAAVIAEDPKHFGFNFNPPLAFSNAP
ncbi:MAG: FHA domain-containing protein [Nitrosomonas sp.]|nr:FHA domain-containing protein [Nitrosomonas sp.]